VHTISLVVGSLVFS